MLNLKNKILFNSIIISALGITASNYYGCDGAEDKGAIPECVNNKECHGGRVCVDEKCVFPSESSTDAGIEEEISGNGEDAFIPTNTELSYLPSGVKVAFISDYDSPGEGIEYYVLDSSGKIKKKTNTPNIYSLNSLSWSPDGKYWAAAMCPLDKCLNGETFHEDIYKIDAATGEILETLLDEAAAEYDPAWSPDGKVLAFTRKLEEGSEICTLTLNNESITILTDDNNENSSPVWSPQGDKLAYLKNIRTNPEGLEYTCEGHVFNFQSGKSSKLASLGKQRICYTQAWSPEGDKIVYVVHKTGSGENAGISLNQTYFTVVDAESGDEVGAQELKYFISGDLSWLPDNKSVVIAWMGATFIDEMFSLYTLNLNSGETAPLTSKGTYNSPAAWWKE